MLYILKKHFYNFGFLPCISCVEEYKRPPNIIGYEWKIKNGNF